MYYNIYIHISDVAKNSDNNLTAFKLCYAGSRYETQNSQSLTGRNHMVKNILPGLTSTLEKSVSLSKGSPVSLVLKLSKVGLAQRVLRDYCKLVKPVFYKVKFRLDKAGLK